MRGAVAAGHSRTAETAAEILRAGGNAFDAAIAGFFSSCVCEPALASLGGGGFLLARDESGSTKVFDFFTHSPRTRTVDYAIDFYPVTVDFGSAQQEFHIGLGSCATPGAVSGVSTVHELLGRLPMAELVQPALEMARDGIEVQRFQAYLLELLTPIYMTDSVLPLYGSPGEHRTLIKTADLFKNPDLADVLEVLAIEGKDLFYRGEIADQIVRLCSGRGYLSYEDLRSYQTILRDPLSVQYRGHRFLTNPPPSAGGVLIAFGLGLLEGVDMEELGFGTYGHIKTLTEVLRNTSTARAQYFSGGPHRGLLDEDLLRTYREEIHDRAAAYRGTTHISVIDAQKNIAAMTVSNGEGCGELVPGTGIMLNNMLGEEDLNPLGFNRWNTNERMSSMMAPSILMDKSGGITALGSGGSNRIRTALLQVVSNITDFGLDLESAVTNPRIHIETDVLNIEADGLSAGTVERLSGDFPEHRIFDQLNMFFGGVHVVRSDSAGGIVCVGDPRRSGVGLVVN